MPDLALGVALDPSQLRVLGALIEKEITTPEQYPLSLNALVNACNQRSSRDPVLNLSEGEVRDALEMLEALAVIYTLRDARVPKYEHRARTVLNLRRDETALLCLLLLRGPQTAGELRSRSDRLYAFDDLSLIQSTLDRLAARAPVEGTENSRAKCSPLTLQLSRQPGAREGRYTHLLGGEPVQSVCGETEEAPSRLEYLEAELQSLREQVAFLSDRLERLESNRTPKAQSE